ncbi:phytanoyl-CoA dioxygenase family protein [Parvularcula sp. IMCC14364]|uniref:phytanoyl-CoA dioxygenase family protein n=1 Tax=Parvularcula sp. IMCC14364 TaxID=3067902 RepID=UPI002741C9C6|nr:phytanoyl-CoA dioxygenase family protein [Parvularcula sp. IMCC14364]
MSVTAYNSSESWALSNYGKNGFAVERGLYSASEIAEVRDLLLPLFDDFSDKLGDKIRDIGAVGDVEPGTCQPEIDRAVRLCPQLVKTSVYRKARALACDLLGRKAHYVFDHAISKMPFSQTSTPWHQDKGYMKANTDLKTVNFWVPLQPTGPENGTLAYIPESHKHELLPHRRDDSLHPHVLKTDVDTTGAVYPCLRMGDLCLHHPLTVHSAGPNDTDQPRLAWSMHFGAYGRLEYLKPSNLWAMLRTPLTVS